MQKEYNSHISCINDNSLCQEFTFRGYLHASVCMRVGGGRPYHI